MQIIKLAEGGSGGGVLIYAFEISIVAGTIITANGGDPGHLGVDGQASCGGVGWIAILYNSSGSYSNGGTIEAIPGDDGTSATLGTACHRRCYRSLIRCRAAEFWGRQEAENAERNGWCGLRFRRHAMIDDKRKRQNGRAD